MRVTDGVPSGWVASNRATITMPSCWRRCEPAGGGPSLRGQPRRRPRRGPYELHVNGSSRIATQPDTLPFRVEKAITARLHYGTGTIDAIARGFGASALPDTEACRGRGELQQHSRGCVGLAGRSTYVKRREHPVAARLVAGLSRAERLGPGVQATGRQGVNGVLARAQARPLDDT